MQRFDDMQRWIIALVLLSVVVTAGCGNNNISGKLVAELKNAQITNGGATQLVVSAENTGKLPLTGEFKVVTEQPDAIVVSYPDIEMLKFSLQPGEKIERRLTITGITRTIRTDYGVNIWIEDTTGKVLDKKAVVLTVQKFA